MELVKKKGQMYFLKKGSEHSLLTSCILLHFPRLHLPQSQRSSLDLLQQKDHAPPPTPPDPREDAITQLEAVGDVRCITELNAFYC